MSQLQTKVLPALQRHRELLIFAPLYAWLSFINYALKIWMTPSWFTKLDQNHALLLQFKYTNNEQSRLLQFYVPEFFHQILGATVQHSYALARLLFVFLTFVCFHRYLRKWFSVSEAFAGVALFAAITPFTHMNDLQESSPLLALLFLLALQAIRDDRIIMLLVVFFLGGLTNETMMILPSVYFFYHARFSLSRPTATLSPAERGGEGRGEGAAPSRLAVPSLSASEGERAGVRLCFTNFTSDLLIPAGKAFLVGLPLILTLGPIRWYNRDRPHLGGAFHWPDNFTGIFNDLGTNPFDMAHARYILFILLFGILWYYAAFGYVNPKAPLFLRRASWIIPFFILAHLITGKIDEPRQMVPLCFIIIPLAMLFLLRDSATNSCTPDILAHEPD